MNALHITGNVAMQYKENWTGDQNCSSRLEYSPISTVTLEKLILSKHHFIHIIRELDSIRSITTQS